MVHKIGAKDEHGKKYYREGGAYLQLMFYERIEEDKGKIETRIIERRVGNLLVFFLSFSSIFFLLLFL